MIREERCSDWTSRDTLSRFPLILHTQEEQDKKHTSLEYLSFAKTKTKRDQGTIIRKIYLTRGCWRIHALLLRFPSSLQKIIQFPSNGFNSINTIGSFNTYNAAGVSRRQDQNVTHFCKKCQHSGIWLLYLESWWKMHSKESKHAWYWFINSWNRR